MKKIKILVIFLAVIILASCSSPKGLQLAKNKNDLIVRGLDNVEGYSPNLKVIASDALFNAPPVDSQLRILKKRKNGEYALEGAGAKPPKYLFQVKDGIFTPADYLWAAGVSDDYQVRTLLASDEMSKAKSVKSRAKGGKKNTGAIAGVAAGGTTEVNTFGVDGSKIQAVDLKDNSVIGYSPTKLSFFLNSADASRLVQFAYNGQDFQMFELEDIDQAGKSKFIVVDLKYGDRFTFMSAEGRFPDISPEAINDGTVKLSGVKLIRNEVSTEPVYLFEINTAKVAVVRESANADDNSCSANKPKSVRSSTAGDNNCDAYYKMKLPPCRKALDANYPNGYYSLDCCDVYKMDKMMFWSLLSSGAIGYDADISANQKTVRVPPGFLDNSPTLYGKYKDKLKR